MIDKNEIEICVEKIYNSVELITTLEEVSLGEAIDTLFEVVTILERDINNTEYMINSTEEDEYGD
jgi:hypothetical protein